MMSTVPEIFSNRVEQTPDSIAYTQFDRNTEAWIDTSWTETRDLVEQWKRGFAASGLTAGDRVAVVLENGLDWVVFDQATLAMGLVTVPLFSTDSVQNWAYVLADCKPRLLIVGKGTDWELLKPLRTEFPAVETVVSLEPLKNSDESAVTLQDWLKRGVDVAKVDVTPASLATITYSSGTTGQPKGVMLTHRNLVSAIRAVHSRIPASEKDIFLAFLPMAHIFARNMELYMAMTCGARIVFARSIAKMPDDILLARPTIMMGVPSVYERTWSRMEKSVSASPIGARLFRAATSLYAKRNQSTFHGFASRAVTNIIKRKVLARYGGRLRLAVSGSAPLSKTLADNLRAVGMPLIEGYGMAEVSGAVSGDDVADYESGTVGHPLDDVEVRLSEQKELLVRSPSVMKGYWGKPEETAQVIDKDGWLSTGDLGEWVGERLKITGRIHEVIGTPTGEKFAPSDVELRITSDELFDQVIVVGNDRPFITALAVLNRSMWEKFAAENGHDVTQPNLKGTENLLLKRIAALTSDLPNYCRVRRLYVTLDPWTAEAGLATVTMKLKRARIVQHFQKAVDALYTRSRN